MGCGMHSIRDTSADVRKPGLMLLLREPQENQFFSAGKHAKVLTRYLGSMIQRHKFFEA